MVDAISKNTNLFGSGYYKREGSLYQAISIEAVIDL